MPCLRYFWADLLIIRFSLLFGLKEPFSTSLELLVSMGAPIEAALSILAYVDE